MRANTMRCPSTAVTLRKTLAHIYGMEEQVALETSS
jgi:hypothetical protein